MERVRVTKQLGPVTTRGKRPPKAIVEEAEADSDGCRNSERTADRVVTINDFVERVYFPRVDRTGALRQ